MTKRFLTFLIASLPLVLMAYESPITEPGAENPTDMYTTTTSGPNQAPGGPHKAIPHPGDVDPDSENYPIGAPWILLGFAAAYAGVRLVKRGRRGVE